MNRSEIKKIIIQGGLLLSALVCGDHAHAVTGAVRGHAAVPASRPSAPRKAAKPTRTPVVLPSAVSAGYQVPVYYGAPVVQVGGYTSPSTRQFGGGTEPDEARRVGAVHVRDDAQRAAARQWVEPVEEYYAGGDAGWEQAAPADARGEMESGFIFIQDAPLAADLTDWGEDELDEPLTKKCDY